MQFIFFTFHCVILWQADNELSSTWISPCMSTRGRGAPHTLVDPWLWNRHLPIYIDFFYAQGLPVYLRHNDPREYTPIFQNFGMCDLNFWIFLFAFAKNGHFWTFIKIFSYTVNLMVLKHFSESSTFNFWPNGICHVYEPKKLKCSMTYLREVMSSGLLSRSWVFIFFHKKLLVSRNRVLATRTLS